MFVHTVIMVIEPHMKQGRQHKLISTIFLATSVTKKLDQYILFDVKHATVSEHITNILASGELDETSVGFSDRSTGGRKPKIYNLDMILSVGYRVNSKRGIAFRKWANNVLKQFILQGYAINEKRLQALKKTVDIQSRMLADALRAVNEYTDALILLDQYDHQTLSKPEGSTPVYRITYEECVQMVVKELPHHCSWNF